LRSKSILRLKNLSLEDMEIKISIKCCFRATRSISLTEMKITRHHVEICMSFIDKTPR